MNNKNLDIENLDVCLNKAVKVVYDYMSNISSEPVYTNINRKDLEDLLFCDVPFDGIGVENVIEDVKKNIVPYCTKIGNPKFLPWIITSPAPAGTIGEIINVGLNQVPFCYKSGPAATVLEDVVIHWFKSLFGYDDKSGGILVSGGSLGTLTALSVAREVHIPGAMNKGIQGLKKPLVVYVSETSHKSVDTAVSVLGIGSDFVRKIPVNKDFQIDIEKLRIQFEKDKALGLDPFCVVGQAGTSNEGAIDDINSLYNFCNKNKIWLHIDAAYAGGAILTERGKSMMKGIEKADSISTDPHKWFFTPVEAGCVLIKNKEHLYNTYKTRDKEFVESEPTEYMNYGIQFTRMSRAFKIWFALRSYGINTLSEIIDNNLDLAQNFSKKINNSHKWQLVAPVQTSAVCFRYIPNYSCTEIELNQIQQNILDKLEKSGKAFLAPATIKGKVAIRACFSNHRTNENDLEFIFKTLNSIANEL